MDRLRRSWGLVRSSWTVVRQRPTLLLFPAASAVAALCCAVPFVAGGVLLGLSGVAAASGAVPLVVTSAALVLLGPLVGAYVAVFFRAAFVHAANEHLAGGRPTLRSGLAGASSCAAVIVPWVLLSASVGVVLRSARGRTNALGPVLAGGAGLTWTLATLLVVPVVVVEGVGVREALTRSSGALRSTWGEHLVGTAGVGLIGGVAALAGLGVVAPVIVAGAWTATPAAVLSGVMLVSLWLGFVALVTSALKTAYQAALYRYVVLGEEPLGFSRDQIEAAFDPQRQPAEV